MNTKHFLSKNDGFPLTYQCRHFSRDIFVLPLTDCAIANCEVTVLHADYALYLTKNDILAINKLFKCKYETHYRCSLNINEEFLQLV